MPAFTQIVLLDPTGDDNDVEVTLDSDSQVWIRQECTETGKVDLVLMDWKMLQDLVVALQSEDGVYVTEYIGVQTKEPKGRV